MKEIEGGRGLPAGGRGLTLIWDRVTGSAAPTGWRRKPSENTPFYPEERGRINLLDFATQLP